MFIAVFVFSHHVVNTGVTNVWDSRYLADSVLNSFMCRPILLLLRHIPDNSLSKIEFCLYTLHFSINDYKLVLFLSLSKKVRRWPPLLPSFIVSGSKSCFYACVNILKTKATSILHKHQQTCNIRFSHFRWQNLKPKTMSLNFKPKLIVDPHPPKKEGRDSEGRERKGSWSELRLRSGNG